MVVRKKSAVKRSRPGTVRKAQGPFKPEEKWIRTTVMIRGTSHSKIKSITYWEKKGIKEVVDEALRIYLKGKKVKPLPKKK
ncbi:MAG: hypothetical protein AB1585_21875 [Thermodesulfobacteriota bacterium]